MNKIWFVPFLPLFLLFLSCTIEQNVETILWEEDKDGFVQFCTNDLQNYGNSFTTSYGSRYDPMGTVEVEVKKVSGSFMGGFGLVFCYQDSENFYLLSIDIQGYCAIYRRTGGRRTTIENWAYYEKLNKGYGSINTLKVAYDNHTNTFSVFINESLVTTFVDTIFSGGYSGCFVDVLSFGDEGFPDHPVDVRFKPKTNSGITVTPTSGLVTTEGGGTDSFTVVLNTRPSADVTIELWNSDPTEGVVSPSSLTFTSYNWSIPQTVMVTGMDDLVDDENRFYTIVTVPAVSSDPAYDGLDMKNVSVSNIDDDPPLAPDNLVVDAVSSTQTNLTWTDHSPNEEGFKIERKRGTNGSFVQIGVAAADTAEYTDTVVNRAADTIYFYRVRAYNAAGDSGYSKEASAIQKLQLDSTSVAIDGDYALVWAPSEGAVYIFHCTGGNNWDSGTKLLAPDTQTGDGFGCAVAIDGDYAIIGATGEDEGGSEAGAAYIFHRNEINSWDFDTKLLAVDAQANDRFGKSVAISGNYAIIGAQGKAYVFQRTGDNSWDSGTKIVPSLNWSRGGFGRSVAIDGDYAVIGDETDYELDWSGAAFIFHRTGTNSWDEYVKILSPDGEMMDYFGCSVAINKDYVIVGADENDHLWDPDSGAAYIFHRIGINSWDAGTKIRAPGRQAYNWFGCAVAIEGDYIVVGARGANEGSTYAGAVYFFHRTGSNDWDFTTKVYSSTGWHSSFGYSVGTDGDHTIVGYGVYILY